MSEKFVFHWHPQAGNSGRMAPAGYFIDEDYVLISCRIYAQDAPTRDATFDIFADGTSIFKNRTPTQLSETTGADISGDDDTTIVLTAGTTSEILADNFEEVSLDEGTWIYCNILDEGGGSNFMVQLEVEPLNG